MFTKIYLFSKMFFDAGTWPWVNRTEEKSIHTHIMSIYRFFFLQDSSDTSILVSDIDFLIDSGFMAPASTLRVLRLSLFAKIIVQEHVLILAALFLGRGRARSFMHAVVKDFQVLTTIGEEYQQYQGYAIAQWCQYIRENHRKFLRDISGYFIKYCIYTYTYPDSCFHTKYHSWGALHMSGLW